MQSASITLKQKQIRKTANPLKQSTINTKLVKIINFLTRICKSTPTQDTQHSFNILNKKLISLDPNNSISPPNWTLTQSIESILLKLSNYKAKYTASKLIEDKKIKATQIQQAIQSNIKRYGSQHSIMLHNILEKE